MPRPRCSTCDFLMAECLCDCVESVFSDRHFLVLQHPKEQHHAKNTLRLLQLAMPDLSVVRAESGPAIEQALLALKPGSALLYPGPHAELWTDAIDPLPSDASLVLIDATWRKAVKMLALNPMLARLPRRALPEHYTSRYRRRKTSVKGGLSTLEALAYAREIDEGCDPEPLLRLLDARMAVLSRHLHAD